MKKYLFGLGLIVSLFNVSALADTPEKLHRFKGYFVSSGNKYPVCVSILEHLVVARGITAFSGYMEYATNFFNDVPVGPPSFSLLGNFTYNGHVIFSLFDRNNSSPENEDLFVKVTDMTISGEGLEKLTLKQGNIELPLLLTRLLNDEVCSLRKLTE